MELFYSPNSLTTKSLSVGFAALASAIDADSAILLHKFNTGGYLLRFENGLDADVTIMFKHQNGDDPIVFMELGAGKEVNIADFYHQFTFPGRSEIYLFCDSAPSEGKFRALVTAM